MSKKHFKTIPKAKKIDRRTARVKNFVGSVKERQTGAIKKKAVNASKIKKRIGF